MLLSGTVNQAALFETLSSLLFILKIQTETFLRKDLFYTYNFIQQYIWPLRCHRYSD